MSNNILISQAEFARLMNVSKQAVSKAIKEKRLTPVIDPKDGKLKLNPDMATAEWRRKTDFRIENSGMSNTGGPAYHPSDTGSDPDDDGVTKESGGLYKAKTDKERMQAKILELEFKEKTGELISAERAKKDAFKLGRLTRDAVLNVPNQICDELAAESDPFQIHHKLTVALTRALDDLVKLASETSSEHAEDNDPEEEVDEEDEE